MRRFTYAVIKFPVDEIVIILLACLGHNSCLAQISTKQSIEFINQVEKFENNGNYNGAIELLKEACIKDSNNIDYLYELGNAYYLKEDYTLALEQFRKTLTSNNVTDECYQMLGNTYDELGDTINCLKAYDNGLRKFPKSGKLYLEEGNYHFNRKRYTTALAYYEEGIRLEPEFPSNYYWASILYCSSQESVWGMLYGEIFINLERNSERTPEISNLLFDTYKREITIDSKGAKVDFTRDNTINITNSNSKHVKMPFGIGVYDPLMLMAIAGNKVLDINTLDKIRTKFAELYYGRNLDTKYPNALFSYQNYILKAGHMEAYNHWVLMQGDPDGFRKWRDSNKEKWNNFMQWFKEHPIPISDSNKFYSYQY